MTDDECIQFASLPGTTALMRGFLDGGSSARVETPRRWYSAHSFSSGWMRATPVLGEAHRERLAALLEQQAEAYGASELTLANIARLRNGGAAVVTGQQVSLFGGPLLTLLKAATAIRRAAEATKATGREHVPVFWLASEDHDLAEVDQLKLPGTASVVTASLGLSTRAPVPVGSITLPDSAALAETLDQVCALLGHAPVCDWLRECYVPGATLAGAFSKLISRIFARHGLIVMDASSREFHAMGAAVLRTAIEHAGELESALLARSKELQDDGYHAQVLVSAGHSLLFLIDPVSGARQSLLRNKDGSWRAGANSFTTDDLLKILDTEPERLSPNALLRPVFQDCVLPTAVYIGGPAEIAYLAQSSLLYERILGRVTPVLLRLSATMVEPDLQRVMAKDEVTLWQIIEAKTSEELSLRLGARAMPIEGKRKIAAAGNAMDTELTALTSYLHTMSAELGRAAGVSANKMRYQMNRLRRMASRFEMQKEASLQKHATALTLQLYPEGHLQERVLGGVWFLARHGDGLADLLVEHAGNTCPGHQVIRL